MVATELPAMEPRRTWRGFDDPLFLPVSFCSKLLSMLIRLAACSLLMMSSAAPAADFDNDGLPDDWQAQYGFSTNGYASTNLVGWWQMNDGSKTNVVDRSGRSLTGMLTNFSAS